MSELSFSITPDVQRLGLVGACFVIRGLENRKSDDKFDEYRRRLIDQLRSEYTRDTLKTNEILAGFKALHQKVGRSNRKFPASPEQLISLFLRKGIIPSINLAVDIYNCISLETKLALGAHDISRIEGNVTLRMTDGSERFVPLGSSESEAVREGEYSYIDDSNEVICRLEFKQVEKTKVTLKTTDCFYIVQGNPRLLRIM